MYIHHEGLPYEMDNQDKDSIIYADRIVKFDTNDSSAFSEIIYKEKSHMDTGLRIQMEIF